jgi:hypothetical protein
MLKRRRTTVSSRSRLVGQAFVEGRTEKAGAMVTTGDVVMSYAEPIARRDEKTGVVETSNEKFSMTTSHHQSVVRGALATAGYTVAGRSVDGKWDYWTTRSAQKNATGTWADWIAGLDSHLEPTT